MSERSAAWAVGSVAAASFLLILLVGLVVAMRPRRVTRIDSPYVKQEDGQYLLASVYRAQRAAHARTGRFDPDLLRASPHLAESDYYVATLWQADVQELCIDAQPRPGADTPPLSMDERGSLHRVPHCDEGVPGARRQRDADAVLTAIYHSERAHFERTGSYEASPAVYAHVPPSPYFTVRVSEATRDQLCVEATPMAGSGLRAASMDEDGWLFEAPGCEDPD